MLSTRYRNVIKSFGVYSISNTLAQLLMMVYSFTLANYLGPDLFGVYSGHLSFVVLTSSVINWGFDTYFLYHSSALKVKGTVSRFCGELSMTKLLIGIPWIILVLSLSQLINNEFFNINILLISALDTLADSIFLTQLTALNIRGKTKELSLLLFFSRLARIIGLLLMVFLQVTLINTLFLVRLFTTVIFMLFAFSISKAKLQGLTIEKIKNLWQASLYYGLSETMALIYAEINISLLAVLLGSVEVGLYSTSSKIIIALYSIPNAGYLLIIPKLREVFTNERNHLASYFTKIQLGFLVVGVLLSLGVFMGGKWIVSLILTEDYLISGDLLQILSVVLILKSLNFGFGALLVALDRQKLRLIPQLVTSLFAILLNVVVIPQFGVLGAAYVFIFTEFSLLIGYAILSMQWFKKNRVIP